MSNSQIFIRLIIYIIGYAIKVAAAIVAILGVLWLINTIAELFATILSSAAAIILFFIILAVMFFIICC